MVGGPEPVIFKVCAGGGLGDVHVCVCGHAVLVDGVFGAFGDLQRGAFGAADARVDVPDAGAAGTVEVVFNEFGAGRGALGLHEHVGPLDGAALAGLADLDDGDGAVFIAEGAAGCHDC